MTAVQVAPPIVEVEGITKYFGNVVAIQDVSLEVRPGEILCLLGDNGAGKSTLIKTISGIHPIDSGEISWAGGPVSITGPTAATHLGIATVYQDLALCDNLDVVANLFLGRETGRPEGPLGLIDEIGMEQRAVGVLQRLSVKLPSVRIPIASLSGGQRQSVAVARSVLWDNKVVLLDEPTAALGVAQTEQVLELIKRLRERGLGVVVISHNLVDVFEVADRIVVLRLGRPGGIFDAHKATREDVVAAITGAKEGDSPDNPDKPNEAEAPS